MPKPEPLSPAALEVEQITPKAAVTALKAPSEPPAELKPDVIPLQLRIPRDKVRVIKVAAAERDMTISEFVVAACEAYIRT